MPAGNCPICDCRVCPYRFVAWSSCVLPVWHWTPAEQELNMEVFISALPKGVRQVKPEEAAEKTEKTEVKEPKAAKDKKEAPTKASVAEVAEKKPKKAVKPIKKVKGAKKTAAGAKGRVWEKFLLAGPWREAEIMLQFDQQSVASVGVRSVISMTCSPTDLPQDLQQVWRWIMKISCD